MDEYSNTKKCILCGFWFEESEMKDNTCYDCLDEIDEEYEENYGEKKFKDY